MMKKIMMSVTLTLACLITSGKPALAADSIRIVTTTSVLADLAGQIAGDEADIFYVASPKRDIHNVTPTPKDVLKVRKADLVIHHGLQAEPWFLPLLNAAGRSDFIADEDALIDASRGVTALEVPKDVTRLEGDIHPMGNPHYWLDPQNALHMVDTISEVLIRRFPSKADLFKSRGTAYKNRLMKEIEKWHVRLSPFQGTKLVTYHRSWSYFANAFSFEITGEIEPKPGIPVTSKHLSALKTLIRTQSISLVITEPHQSDRPAQRLVRETEAKTIELLQFNGVRDGVDDYISLMEYNVTQIENALGGNRND